MRLIFLHGPPASGKYTIAKELETRAGFSIFHNHLTIDVVRPFFPFGTPQFWDLLGEVRLLCLRHAARNSSATVVFTSCYDHPDDLGFYEEIESIVHEGAGEVVPIYLSSGLAELKRRVSAPSRVAMGKMVSPESLERQLCDWNCIAVPRDGCRIIATEGRSPRDCA